MTTSSELSMADSVKDLLTFFKTRTAVTRTIITHQFMLDDIIKPSILMGEEPTEGMPDMQISSVNEHVFQERVKAARSELSAMQQKREAREKRLLNICLFSVGFAAALIVSGGIFLFLQPNDKQLGVLTSLSSVLPTILSGSLFMLYQKEKEHTKAIDDDTRQLLKIEAILGIIAQLPDRAMRQATYPKIFEQLKI